MRLLAPTSLLAIALAALPAGQIARAQDAPAATPVPTPTPAPFRLPPRATPTPTDVQGPVDPDAPILTRPRAPTPAPRPTATTPAPTPTPTAVPRPQPLPAPRSTRAPNSTLPPRFTPPAAPTPQESAAAEADAAELFPAPSPTTAAPAPAPTLPNANGTIAAAGDESDENGPGWLLALGGLLLTSGIGAAIWWRRRDRIQPAAVGTIERPRVAPPAPVAAAAEGAPPAPVAGAAAAAAAAGAPLVLEARAIKLSRSMRFATLSYEVTAVNRSGRPLENVRFGGDLVTAHARVPTAQQLADPALPLAPMQDVARLEPGQTMSLAGELRLPVNEIRPIPHGKAVVYVPLLRLRAQAAGMEPVARTFVIGLLPAGSGQRLQPFRLDEMPQTYSAVGQKALD